MKISKMLKCSLAVGVILVGSLMSSQGECATNHSGTVISTMKGGGYTYVKVDEKGEKYWIAGPETSVKVGGHISFSEQIWMSNFESKSLKRVFDKVLLVNSIKVDSASSHSSTAGSSAPFSGAAGDFKKAKGGYTVEEVFANRDKLNGKIVKVRGKVAKVSPNILGKNWIHIKDGTGSKGTDDLVFRSNAENIAVGSVILAQGTLVADKDFGSGYFYKAIVEDSTFSK